MMIAAIAPPPRPPDSVAAFGFGVSAGLVALVALVALDVGAGEERKKKGYPCGLCNSFLLLGPISSKFLL
jgi:hypothetical protein